MSDFRFRIYDMQKAPVLMNRGFLLRFVSREGDTNETSETGI